VSDQIVPLTAAPNQSFSAQLTVDGAPLTLGFQLAFLAMSGYWELAIFDSAGDMLVSNVPLITGWYPGGNLLGQYGYLRIGSAYLLNTGNAVTDYPGSGNLDQFSLLWGNTVLP
jgi:hypothetical protein